jgi:hypothetical protein
MYKDKESVLFAGLTMVLVLVSLYYICIHVIFDSNFFFCIVLLGLSIVIVINRKTRLE